MRLQLIVQRHSLPPVQVLWTVGVLRPPYAAAGTSATISQLLEQINEIIPLESGDWGLEDYAVEVRGFECLHFSEISQVLKDDDEVCIRPLQTSDLRFRKVSGRHQISTDGKHLIDGVAFGRPFLRRPDRPAIRIPPRKRRRVTYDEDEDSDLAANFHGQQVMLRTGINNEDRSLDSDQEDDGDFSPDEDKENDLSSELQDIYNDVEEDSARAISDTERATNLDGVEEPPGRLTRSQNAKRGLGLQGAAMLELVDENGRPYPGEYNNPLLDLFGQDELPHSNHDTTKHKNNNQKLHHHGKSKAAVQVYQENPERVSRRSSIVSIKSVRFEDPDSNTPATIRGLETMNHINHQDFEPGIDIAVDHDESDKENSQPHFEAYQPSASPSILTSSSSSSSSEHEDDDEETSSSGSSTADSSSDSESERHPTTSSLQPAHSDNSSQTSSSIINSDLEAEQPAGNPNGTGVAVTKGSPALANLDSKKPEVEMQANAQQIQGSSLPYEGKVETRRRNQRRRSIKQMKKLKSIGLIPNNVTLRDFHRLKGDENRVNGVPEELGEDADLELRRDALLEAITSGGLEVSRDFGLEDVSASANIQEALIKCHAATTEDAENRIIDDQPKTMQDVEQSANREPDVTTAVTEAPISADHVGLGPSKCRSKLDLASSRRLLFGSLGLPTPRNKEDELKIREQLMKDVKRSRPSEPQIEVVTDGPLAVGELEENEQWKDKIVLKAVECCYDGVELSTPPFPFVQRWDPQQQRGHEGLKKGKNLRRSNKRKREDEKFYEQVPIHNLKDGKTDANTVAPGTEENPDKSFSPPQVGQQQQIASRRDCNEYEVAVNDQLKRETDASAIASAENGIIQDLPMLPDDMSTCTPLTKEASFPGAIVAFKQLDMSQETNWQPTVSGYRTALVERLMENGIVRMTLAQRDQPQIQKSYNQQTGERIYSKFEMPGFNDDESLENGIVELSFAELIEPKLICAASVELLGMDDQKSWSHGAGLPHEVVAGESTDINLIDYNMPSPKLPYSSINGSKTDRGRQEVRKEIFDLITDAGWRSSIRSKIDQERVSEDHLSPNDQEDDRGQELVDPISPKFLGFSSSLLKGGRIGSSSPPRGGTAGAASELAHITDQTTDPVSSPQPASILEVAESLPFQRIAAPDSPLMHISSHGDEDLDVKAEDEDEKPAGDESQPNSGLPEAYHLVSSQRLVSSRSPYRSVPTSTRDLQHHPPAKELILSDDTESDDFPMVEDITQIRSSYAPSSVDREDSTYMESSSFETVISKDEPISIPEVRKVKPDGKKHLSEKQTLFKWGESEGGEDQITPRASQVPAQSQVVDLTLSSDPAGAADGDYVDYGTQLPSGPGWVQKKKGSGRRFSTVEPNNGRSRRTRNTSSRAFS